MVLLSEASASKKICWNSWGSEAIIIIIHAYVEYFTILQIMAD